MKTITGTIDSIWKKKGADKFYLVVKVDGILFHDLGDLFKGLIAGDNVEVHYNHGPINNPIQVRKINPLEVDLSNI